MLTMLRYLIYLSFITLISGCSLFQRSSGSGFATDSFSPNRPRPLSPAELQKNAYELGVNPDNGFSTEQMSNLENRQRLKELELRLGSQKEREQYSKILPLLSSDREKIQFLSIPSLEGRQAWINRNGLWQRSAFTSPDILDAAENGDIALGMSAELVRKAWGEPQSVEVSGNPAYKNERWRYSRSVASDHGFQGEKKYIYFEGGRVVGWDSE